MTNHFARFPPLTVSSICSCISMSSGSAFCMAPTSSLKETNGSRKSPGAAAARGTASLMRRGTAGTRGALSPRGAGNLTIGMTSTA